MDTVDKELLEKMRDAGCIEIKFGVESGSEKILKSMRKRITKADTLKAFQLCKEVGINAKAFIIHGYPGENMQTTDETIDLLQEIGDLTSRVSLFRFVPLPGTQVYEEKDESGQYVIHGTHLADDWDGDWSKFHLYRNGRHWWGGDSDFAELNEAYRKIRQFTEDRWGRQE
ncbi:MAG TPA: radical SAM protein [Candidatus Saccharimonadales bacterium]